jgi:formylglycine-generating enzyme required for sulfatase activity
MAGSTVCQGATCATHPQPCVDWCDAAAYCRAIGRSLCTDENWANACSSNGAYANGLGDTLVGDPCNTSNTTTVPVASRSGCHPPAGSPFAGVFDMIGNIAEWVDYCVASTGATDDCRYRSYAFTYRAAGPMCNQWSYRARSGALDTVGIRCCAP